MARSSAAAEERDTEFGYGRTQPEFSLGERMATMEANQRKDEEHGKAIAELVEKLVDEKLVGVRSEMDTKDKARQDAIDKAEKAAQERAVALATELRQFTDQAQTRFGALERGGAGLSGEKAGFGESTAAGYVQRAERQAQKANQVAIATGVLAGVALLRAAGVI
jgi:hypothetical protein